MQPESLPALSSPLRVLPPCRHPPASTAARQRNQQFFADIRNLCRRPFAVQPDASTSRQCQCIAAGAAPWLTYLSHAAMWIEELD